MMELKMNEEWLRKMAEREGYISVGGLLVRTYQEYVACLDAQIEALLYDDFDEFYDIIEYIPDEDDLSHFGAWNITSDEELSLFANLPGCNVCASQAEYLDQLGTMKVTTNQSVIDRILKDTPLKLPNLNEGGAEDYKDFRFTREQLEEFKRRQIVARYPGGA